MSFGASDAAVYDVKYQVNVGEFTADNKTVEDVYLRTTGGMSDASLRAAVAQEKLDRAIAQHGPTSLAAKTATLAYRKEMAALGDQAVVTGSELDATGRRAALSGAGFRSAENDANKFGRGLLSGTGLMNGFGRAAAFASTTFLGGAGLVFAIRAVIHASEDEQVALTQVKNALDDNGLSWHQYGSQITHATSELETHTAFTKTDLLTTLSNLIRRTGDVTQSIHLTATAADLARGRNIGLADAGNILIKALNGQTSALTRMGIQVTKVTTAQDALRNSGVKANAEQLAAAKATDLQATKEGVLAAVRQKYGNAAAAYLQTEAGKQALLNTELKDSEAIIGRGLEPTIEKLLNSGAKRLEQMNKDGSLQRDVNSAIKDGTAIVHGFTDAIHLLAPPIETVVSVLGGIEHATEIALVLGLAAKARSAASSLTLITTASGRARTQILADATLEERALAGVATQAAETSGVVSRVGLYTRGGVPIPVGGGGGAGGAATTEESVAGGIGIGALLKKGATSPAAIAALLLASTLLPKGKGSSEAQGAVTAALVGSYFGGPVGAGIAAGGYLLSKNANAITNLLPGQHAGPMSPAEILKLAQQAAQPDPTGKFRKFLDTIAQFGAISNDVYTKLVAIWTAANTYTVTPGPNTPTSAGGTRVTIPSQITGSYKTPAPKVPPPVTGLSYSVQSQLLDAQISGKPADQLVADQAAEAELRKLLGQPDLTHADILTLKSELAQYSGDASSIEASIKSGQSAAASKAAAKKAAAQRAYASGVSIHASGLSDDVTSALKLQTKAIRTTRGPGGKITIAGGPGFQEPDAQKTLAAFYEKEATDTKLTAAEEARYHTLYINELAKVALERDQYDAKVTKILDEARKKEAAELKLQQGVRDQMLQNRLAEAQLAETEAGTNAAGVKKAQAAEVAAELAILKQQQLEGAKLTGLAKQQNIAEQLATRQAIAQLKNGTASVAAAGENDESQFLSTFATIVGSYAPNAFPPKLETHGFNTVHELRSVNTTLRQIAKAESFPFSRAAEVAIQAAFG